MICSSFLILAVLELWLIQLQMDCLQFFSIMLKVVQDFAISLHLKWN